MYTLGLQTNGQPIILSAEERRRHLYISGSTGSGKTTLLYNLAMDDFRSGRGFCFIDPHGDVVTKLADSTPIDRVNQTIYFDPLNPDDVVGFNPIKKVSPLQQSVEAARLLSAFKHVWSEFWGPRMAYVLENALLLLLAQNAATLLDIPTLLTDETFRKKLLRKCDDFGVKFVWEQEFHNLSKKMKAEWISPVQNKAGRFRTNKILRDVVGQKSKIDVEEIMNNDKVLLCNFSKRMGEEPSHLLGALLVTAFGQAAEARAEIPEEERKDFTLYVDEFQNFTSEAFATILSEARKWRLNLVVAHQYLAQLDEDHTTIRQAVMGNASTFVVFRIGAEDADLMGKQLDMNGMTLTRTEAFKAYVKTPTMDATLIATLPPTEGERGNAWRVLENTRAWHTRSRADVERDIQSSLPKAKKPKGPLF